jgi:hypothetical protein
MEKFNNLTFNLQVRDWNDISYEIIAKRPSEGILTLKVKFPKPQEISVSSVRENKFY